MALVVGLFLFILCFAVGVFFAVKAHGKPPEPFIVSPNDRYCTVRGHRLHYTQYGQGKDVLLLHGIGASQFVWRFLLPRLSQFFRVTSVDLLGFGYSDKPEDFSYGLDSQCEVINEFLSQMGIQKTFLVGSSMGGAIVLRLAQLHPEKFPAITVISPCYDPNIAYFDLNRIAFLSPVVQPLITERFVKQIMKRVYSDHSLISPETVIAFARPYSSKAAIDAFAKSFRLLRDPRVFTDLPSIRSQTLILWGSKDKIIPVKFSKAIQFKIPNSTLDIHPTAGHHVQEDAPEWSFEKIKSFFS